MGALSDRLTAANALGRENLADKGVELPESATTYDIMQGIADITNTPEYIEGICTPSRETHELTPVDSYKFKIGE